MTGPEQVTPEILFTRFGDYLVEKGTITSEDLQRALQIQKNLQNQGKSAPLVGNLLVEMGVIDRATLDQALTEQILALRSALLEANQKLEIRVQQRTAELEQAIQRLSELNEQKSNFVANVSHELRTPLTHLRGYLDLLISGELGELNPTQAQSLSVMERATDRLAHLIDDLIMFSSAEEGQVFIRVKPFDSKRIFQQVASYAQSQSISKSISIELDFPDTFPVILGDEEKILWVLQQLVDNAVKFTPQKGTITLGFEINANLALVSISDSGIGIPEEKLSHVFEPFYQIDSSSTRKAGGMGLGLALVKKIIEAHGSVITLTSQVGHGSRFEFILKLADQSASEAAVKEVKNGDASP